MWRYVANGVTGASHLAEGSPCQDSRGIRTVGEGDEQVLVACVADGAGSARFGGEGAAIACHTVLDSAAAFLLTEGNIAALTADEVRSWCDLARERIRDQVVYRECTLRDFATTVCGVVIDRRQGVFFQIGDSSIVARRNGAMGVVFWPQSGEYANTTNFLTADAYHEHLEFTNHRGAFDDLALFTDGIERMALSFQSRTPHPPFFQPFFAALQATTDVEHLTQEVGQFLQSRSVQTRSDDDKTLIIATRIPSRSAPNR